MFIGKSVCIVAVGAITGICLLCAKDKNMELRYKIELIALTSGLGAIVASL